MNSKRNSYFGRRKVEPASTVKRRRERATQKAKQEDQVVEIAHESGADRSERSIKKTEERGCVWWLGRSCIFIPYTAVLALLFYGFLTDDQYNQIWRDWRFIVLFVVFSSLVFSGLRDNRLKFLVGSPVTALFALLVRTIWVTESGDFDAELSNFWWDWRFIIPLVLFTFQTFLGLKEGSDSCLWNLFRFCFIFPIVVTVAFLIYLLFLFIIYGDSFEFRWDRYLTIFLLFVYYVTFLGVFGFLERWITCLEGKLKEQLEKQKNKKR